MTLDAQGIAGRVLAPDGMPLVAPQPLKQGMLPPAQRVDPIVDVTNAPGDKELLFAVEGGQGIALDAPDALPANPIALMVDISETLMDLAIEGGTMPAHHVWWSKHTQFTAYANHQVNSGRHAVRRQTATRGFPPEPAENQAPARCTWFDTCSGTAAINPIIQQYLSLPPRDPGAQG